MEFFVANAAIHSADELSVATEQGTRQQRTLSVIPKRLHTHGEQSRR